MPIKKEADSTVESAKPVDTVTAPAAPAKLHHQLKSTRSTVLSHCPLNQLTLMQSKLKKTPVSLDGSPVKPTKRTAPPHQCNKIMANSRTGSDVD